MEGLTEFLSNLATNGVRLSAEGEQLHCFAQKGALTSEMKAGILKYKADIMALFQDNERQRRVAPHEFPLAAGQKGLYMLHALHPGISAYNVPLCFKIGGDLDVTVLGEAWQRVLDRFPILTARVIQKDGDLYHQLDKRCRTTLRSIRLNSCSDIEFQSYLRQQAKIPFDLDSGPLARIQVLERDDREPVLLITVHHIIFDGVSSVILLKTLFGFYEELCAGRTVQLSSESPGYAQFVAWEKEMLTSDQGAAHAAFWREKLAGDLPVINLLPGNVAAVSPSFDGKTLVEFVPKDVSEWVRQYTKNSGVRPAALFLFALQLLLHKYTQLDDFIVGMPVMKRPDARFKGEIGYFVNMTPIRSKLAAGLPAGNLMRMVQGAMLDAIYHSDYPFPAMLEGVKTPKGAKNPVFQVMFGYQNYVQQSASGLTFSIPGVEHLLEISQEGDFDLGIEVFEDVETFRFHVKYNPAIYSDSIAARIGSQYRAVLTEISCNPDLTIGDYSDRRLIDTDGDTGAACPEVNTAGMSAEVKGRTTRKQSGARKRQPIEPVDRSRLAHVPLSFGQERLWFFDQMKPGSSRYNYPAAVTIRREVDAGELEFTINQIVHRHESLRTIFPSISGHPEQVILDDFEVKLDRVDLTMHEDRDRRLELAKSICQAEAARPFDLVHGPLLRGKLLRIDEKEHVLLLNMHHIVSDAWSMNVLIEELREALAALREGRALELPALRIQYADYAVWQRTWLENSELLAGQMAYWKSKLAGVPESLDLATDFPRGSVQSLAGATQFFSLGSDLTAQLKSVAQSQGATLYMLLLAIFNVLLYRYSGQADICVGSLIANRQYGETERLVGVFFNTLALRNTVNAEATFSSFLSQVKQTCREAFANQDAPFEKIVDLVRPRRNASISPLFQVMCVLHNSQPWEFDEEMQPYPLDSSVSQFDLTAGFRETPTELEGSFAYCTELFKPETVARMARHFVALCRDVVKTPLAQIHALNYLDDTDTDLLTGKFNDTGADYPTDRCIHELFLDHARANGEKTAVVFEERSLTFRELAEQSGDVALYLQTLGVRPDSIVGLCLERSLEMMLGMYGVVRAGGAYLPLDPDYPDERLAFMLADSQAKIVLTQARFAGRIEGMKSAGVRVVALDTQLPAIRLWASAVKERGAKLEELVKPDNLCYVIYTSGSTGNPKGVLTEHRPLVNRLNWMQKQYSLDTGDIVLQKTPYSFDVSVWEFFWPMIAGAGVVFAAPHGHKDVQYLESLIESAGVTTLHFVPSMLHSFLETSTTTCARVKRIFCSGEALDKESADAYPSRFPNAALFNLYGPTEAAIDVTAYPCVPGSELPFVPIGAPIDNTQIHILDSYGKLQPIGVPGELYIAGDGLARGYLNRPELTRERFVSNPFSPGKRMYKTGDLARWLDNGVIQYLGRIDTQTKIRGFRIETGEIEACLNQFPGVAESAVVPQGSGSDKRLVAFYRASEVQKKPMAQLANEDLRTHLARHLPEYMIPAAFVSLPEIPLNSNGKVDRRALAAHEVNIASAQAYVAPRTPIEAQLVAIWAELLRVPSEKIGINDNFFDLGGHSLLAVKLIQRMNEEGMKTTLPALFAAPTLGTLAEALAASKPGVGIPDATDFDLEVALDPTIMPRTQGRLGAVHRAFLTGASGFVGAFLLFDLLNETDAIVHCLVRASNVEDGFRKIESRMSELGIWDTSFRDRIIPELGDLGKPRLGLTVGRFAELGATIDLIYHSGAAVNFLYPYSALKAANVGSTVELISLASFGRAKSLHYVSTLHVTSSKNEKEARSLITEGDPLPPAVELWDGYAQSKWVAEKIVQLAGSRGLSFAIYRPPQIIGHSVTGVANLTDFVPSVILACMQVGCVPEDVPDDELHLVPVDYVSRSVVGLSNRTEFSGRVFHLTNPETIPLSKMLTHLLAFEPRLKKTSYEAWRALILADAGNALERYIASFPDRVPEKHPNVPPRRFECDGTLHLATDAGAPRPDITPELLDRFFGYLSQHAAARTH